MIYGNAAWGLRELSVDEQLKITSEMGLSVLELGIANAPNDLPANANPEQIQKIADLYKKYNVKLMCAATGNDFTVGNKDDVDKVKKTINICSLLGIEYLRIFAGFSPIEEVTGERWQIMIDNLKNVCEYAKELNVVLAIETHGGVIGFADGVKHIESVTTNIDSLVSILDEIPELMIVYDPANLAAVGIVEQKEFFDKLKDRICYIHLKDFKMTEMGGFIPCACGEGILNNQTVIDLIENADVPFLFEYELTEDVSDGLQRCYNYIKKIN